MTQTQRGKSAKHSVKPKPKPKPKAKPMVKHPQNHDPAKDLIKPPEQPDHPAVQPPDKPDKPDKPEPPALKGHEAILHRIGYGPMNTAQAYRELAREALEK